MKYLVKLAGKEWAVEVDSASARVGGEAVHLEAGTLPGERVAVSGGRRLRFLLQPPAKDGREVLLVVGRLLEAFV